MEPKQYLSRDLRQTISETFKQNGVTPTKRLIEEIYDLVITETVDAQYQAVSRKVDAAIERLEKQMKKKG